MAYTEVLCRRGLKRRGGGGPVRLDAPTPRGRSDPCSAQPLGDDGALGEEHDERPERDTDEEAGTVREKRDLERERGSQSDGMARIAAPKATYVSVSSRSGGSRSRATHAAGPRMTAVAAAQPAASPHGRGSAP